MPLRLHFTARARLWAEIVHSRGERVFVATAEALRPGDAVTVEVEAPELSAPLSLTGAVVSLRPAAGQFPAGVQVTFDEASVRRCEAALGVSKDESLRVAGRIEPRVDCNLPARLISPEVVEGCAVRNLSSSGLTLFAPARLDKDATFAVQLKLPVGPDALFSAQVMWARAELKLAGMKITTIDARTSKRLSEAVATLLSQASGPRSDAATVVAADDDPSILDFVTRVVTKAGFRVVRADRGDTALALIRSERPQLAFLDVLMPGADGLEVCKAVRSDASLANVPVVLLSAMGEDRLAKAAKEAGASDYLTKPMRLDAMRLILAKYLGPKPEAPGGEPSSS